MATTMEPDAVPLTLMEAADWAESLADRADYETALAIVDDLARSASLPYRGTVILTNAQRMRDALLAATRQRRQ